MSYELEEDDDLDNESEDNNDDIALAVNHSADPADDFQGHINPEIFKLYDVYSYRHAASILKTSFPSELEDIELALINFKITQMDIGIPGGNESIMPKKISHELRPKNWYETRIQGDLIVRVSEKSEEVLNSDKLKIKQKPIIKLQNYVDGHKIDYVKGRVAFDLEWNSKDQTFDRDLYAFRMFHECGVISAAVICTRSEKLNPLFNVIPLRRKDASIVYRKNGTPMPCKQKYGASTTWIGKLLYRLNAGRHGSCPVLVFAIKPEVVSDWNNERCGVE